MASFGLEEVASAEGELHFDRDMHVAYFKSCLRKGFPHQYTSMDTQRMTAVYFSLSALDMLGEVESLDKAKLIDFVYSWQLEPRSPAHGGFVGTSSMGNPLGGCLCFERGDAGGAGSCEKGSVSGDCCIMKGHLAMAYTSLASLIILGDASLSRVNRPALVAQVRALQQTDGSFAASGDEAGECDVRFVYCACVVSYLLGDWDGVNTSAALRFVLSCVTYEGGLALRPGGEAHGGSCYCGVASIMLMGLMDEAEKQLPGFRRGVQVSVHGHMGHKQHPPSASILLCSSPLSLPLLTRAAHLPLLILSFFANQEFCQWRQVGGYQGRTNKPPDSCYSFWHGGSLRMLGKVRSSTPHSTLISKPFLQR
jgi:geranylgeranyl transferase type-1 subunit beta